MGTENKTLRQRCALYILDNPSSSMLEIVEGTHSCGKGVKVVCKLLKSMLDEGELTREGTRKNYTYSAGPNIARALSGERPTPKRGRTRKGSKNNSIMTIRQTWVRADDYTIEPGGMIYRDIWTYAETFST